MADLKVTKMVMKVDLQCSKCYRKIKKVLCRYPQIRDQMYDEKQNKVTITVVCCSPEKIKEKIACKAGDTVESIEIVPDKTEEQKNTKPAERHPKVSAKPTIPDPSLIPPPSLLVPVVPPPDPDPMCPLGVCCCCYEGRPCYHGRGLMCYDGCGRPAYECSGGNRGYVSRCDEYFCEENALGCSVM